jgi:hypothetical protein
MKVLNNLMAQLIRIFNIVKSKYFNSKEVLGIGAITRQPELMLYPVPIKESKYFE